MFNSSIFSSPDEKKLFDYLTKFFENHSNVPYMFNNGYWSKDKIGIEQQAYYLHVDIDAPIDSAYEDKNRQFLSVTLTGCEAIVRKFRGLRTKNNELIEEVAFMFNEVEANNETPFPPPDDIVEIMKRDRVSIVLQAMQCKMIMDENAAIENEMEEVGRKIVIGDDAA